MTAEIAKPVSHAVIDIGSNSVRLVIFHVAGQAMLPHYNERVMAGLGEGLAETGQLSPEGIERALRALRRFRAILDGLSVTRVRAVATAAVRAADDGKAFIDRAKAEAGFLIDILPGEEEAKLSAYGVAATNHLTHGLVGDLGGSSLEFADISKGRVTKGESFSLGPFSMAVEGERTDAIEKKIKKVLRTSDLLPQRGGRFFMVGGAWRALAKFHMDLGDYPLGQLHAYRLDKKAIELIYEASQSKDAILRQRLARASQKRAAVLPYAAMVLNQVVQLGGFDEIIVSASGLREGVIRHGLPNTAGKRDPLFDGIDLYLRLPDQARRFGHSLFGWLGGALRQGPDLFGDVDVSDRILEAACRLADSGARFHPDHRASMVFDQVLRGPFTGVTHTERLFLALAVGHRYARGLRCPERLQPLLAPGLVDFAAQLGACMRVGCVYSGRSADVLKTSRLERSRDALVLSVETPRTAMVSNEVERRLATAADLLGSRPEVRTH